MQNKKYGPCLFLHMSLCVGLKCAMLPESTVILYWCIAHYCSWALLLFVWAWHDPIHIKSLHKLSGIFVQISGSNYLVYSLCTSHRPQYLEQNCRADAGVLHMLISEFSWAHSTTGSSVHAAVAGLLLLIATT
jgi:hypothetical protein